MGLLDFLKPKNNGESEVEYDKELFERTGMKGKVLYRSKPLKHVSYLKEISKYSATKNEVELIKDAINKNGFWEESYEWRISTVMSSRIEPKIENGRSFFITTVKCEQEVMIPAGTIERAIIFKKLYQDFQMELWHEQGWASWTEKGKP
ncbi:hypothetical protein [Flavobacterium sp. UBA7663]|uniref:hypothetical protein n=1 Tax=Flavobacterium sp. UBA7663 TaxID=1946557 RepID=UPI0025BDFDDE|nr:hypothetical protein [Flavobacterium sp. UBA7663]